MDTIRPSIDKSAPTLSCEAGPVDRYSVFIIRGTIIGAGVLGLTLFIRNSRLFATYHHVNQIPEDFVRKGLELKGVVREVLPNGWLRVQHQPFAKLPRVRILKDQQKKSGFLNLRLAGLDVSPVGVEYLENDLKIAGRPVTFTLIKSVENMPDVGDAEVNLQKIMRRINLNVELVRKGFARVWSANDINHIKALQFNSNYSRLITQLLTSEKVADRRGLGLWSRKSWVENVSSFPSAAREIIKHSTITKLLVLLFEMLRDLCLVFFFILKQLFYIGQTIGSYALEGYQRLGRGVTRLADWYDRTRKMLTGAKRFQLQRKT